MPEYLKALLVILTLAFCTCSFFKPAFTSVVTIDDFNRRRKLWFFLTTCLFLSHNFWLYIVVSGIALFLFTKKDDNKVAVYFFLLFAIPPISALIPGFGVVNVLFTIDYPRLLTLVLLLPVLIHRSDNPRQLSFPSSTADVCILGYIGLYTVLIGLGTSMTDLARNVFNMLVDIFLPFYAASRILCSTERFRDAIGSFLVAAAIMAPMAVFEMARSWLLYASLKYVIGVPWPFFGYLLRDGGLRAAASAGHPLVLAYIMVVALGFYFYIRHSIKKKGQRNLLGLVLLAGLIAPLSRGPWLGGLVLLLAFLITGKYTFKQVMGWITSLATILLLIGASPYGEKIAALLPFVGHVDESNISYRQQLAENSITLLKSSPFFGVPNALGTSEMQSMKQGEGIVDIVNTYVAIGLGSGVIGLSLFLGVFLSVCIGLLKAIKQTRQSNEELNLLGRVLFAVLCSVLFMIATLSSIMTVPIIYWMLAGMGVAYLDLVRRTLALATPGTAGNAAAAAMRLTQSGSLSRRYGR